MGKSLDQWETFDGAPRPGATEAMACVSSLILQSILKLQNLI